MGRTLDAWREMAENAGYSGEPPMSTVDAINATVAALGGEGTAKGIAEAVTNLAQLVGGGGGAELGELVTVAASATLEDFSFWPRVNGIGIAIVYADTEGTSVAAGIEVYIDTNGSKTGTYKIGDAEALPMTVGDDCLKFTIPATTPIGTTIIVDGNF